MAVSDTISCLRVTVDGEESGGNGGNECKSSCESGRGIVELQAGWSERVKRGGAFPNVRKGEEKGRKGNRGNHGNHGRRRSKGGVVRSHQSAVHQ